MKKIVFLLLLAVSLLLSGCAVYDGYGYEVVAPVPAVVVYPSGYYRPYYGRPYYRPHYHPAPPHRHGPHHRH